MQARTCTKCGQLLRFPVMPGASLLQIVGMSDALQDLISSCFSSTIPQFLHMRSRRLSSRLTTAKTLPRLQLGNATDAGFGRGSAILAWRPVQPYIVRPRCWMSLGCKMILILQVTPSCFCQRTQEAVLRNVETQEIKSRWEEGLYPPSTITFKGRFWASGSELRKA